MDYSAITGMTRETWSAGDFSVIARSDMPAAEALVASADPHANARVLDVACGSGNVALVAARRHCVVTGVDFAPGLLERARERARAERLDVRFVDGDCQALPSEDAAFDFVFSSFGVMFAPDQGQAARELARVCRPGGTLALANWSPEGASAEFFRIVAENLPPAPGLEPPTRWGTAAGIHALFGAYAARTRFSRRSVTEYYRSVEHGLDQYRRYFGPIERAFGLLDAQGQQRLSNELAQLFSRENRATDGTLAIPFDYLEVLIERA